MPRGGAKSAAHIGAFVAGGRRYHNRKKLRQAEVSSGRAMGGGLNPDGDPRRAHMDVSPAVWLRADAHIGDCQYLNGDLDEVLLRALRERVVYADNLCCHHETPFHEVTTATLAAVEKQYNKKKKKQERLTPPVATGLLKPFKLKKPKKTGRPKLKPPSAGKIKEMERKIPNRYLAEISKATGYREGRSLTEVVGEMFE